MTGAPITGPSADGPLTGPSADGPLTGPTVNEPVTGSSDEPLTGSTVDEAVTGDGLHARLVVERDGFRLDAALSVAPGEVVALLGPNGAGKTTALRALAGLVPVSDGFAHLDGAPLAGLAPERRPIGVVFQDYRLFPHLSAVDNIAFGPRCRGLSRRAARAVALDWLSRMDLTSHAATRPAALSGGQAQRVALARALAAAPRLLLLDEPLAALDARTRGDVRTALRHHLADFPGATVLVTHDPLDAMVLADRLVVIESGRVVQTGLPTEITRRPGTEYVARLVGLNFYRGTAEGRLVSVDGATIAVATEHTGEVCVAFRPAAVALYRSRPDGSPRNLWPVRVAAVDRHGDYVRVQLDGRLPLAADVTPDAIAALDLTPGRDTWAAVKATEIAVYPAA